MKRRRAYRGQVLTVRVLGSGSMAGKTIGGKKIVGDPDKGRRRRLQKAAIDSKDLLARYGADRKQVDKPRDLEEVQSRDLKMGDLIERDGKLHRVVRLTDTQVILALVIPTSGTLKSRKKRLKLSLEETAFRLVRGRGGSRDVAEDVDPNESQVTPDQRGQTGWVSASATPWTTEVSEAGAVAYYAGGTPVELKAGEQEFSEEGARLWG